MVGTDHEDGPTSVVALSPILLPESPLAARNPGVVVEYVGLQPRRPGEIEGLGRLGDPDGDHRAGGEVELGSLGSDLGHRLGLRACKHAVLLASMKNLTRAYYSLWRLLARVVCGSGVRLCDTFRYARMETRTRQGL